MKNEMTKRAELPQWLGSILEMILPRALQEEYIGMFKDSYDPRWQFLPNSAATVASGYRIQSVGAFDKTATAAQIGALLFCFASVTTPVALLVPLGIVLGALFLRDGFTHP